jgi:hypothetical protein
VRKQKYQVTTKSCLEKYLMIEKWREENQKEKKKLQRNCEEVKDARNSFCEKRNT